ncbi:MAG: hypothetical protein ABIP64_03130 [Burkholderiales bacterium]
MKKVDLDDLRPEYERSDLGKMIRGKYAKRMTASSNVIVLRPEVARAFPNDEAVNDALASLIDLAKKSTENAPKSSRTRGK